MSTSREQCLAEIHRLLAQRAGLDCESLGRQNVAHAVDKRMGLLGLQSPRQLLGRLQADASAFQELLEEIVVLETWFFRDPEAFNCLKSETAKWRPAGGNALRAFSVACSTGEEPYSMAMMLRESGLEPTQFRVLGIDLSERALRTAREAVYAVRSFREDSPPFRVLGERWCERIDESWRVQAEIRAAVEFRWGNLAQADFLADEPPFQVVFCRNVLIYFHPRARRAALAHLRRLTSPGGLVCCAPAEARILSEAGFTSLGSQCPFAFRRSPELPATRRPVPQTTAPVRQVRRPSSPVTTTPQRVRTKPGPANESAHEDESESSLLQRARQAADLGQLDRAEIICAEVLARNPASAEAHYLRGVMRQSQGVVAEARQWFEKTLYLDPRHYEALIHLMLLAEQSGDLAQASNYRRRAEHIVPAEVDG